MSNNCKVEDNEKVERLHKDPCRCDTRRKLGVRDGHGDNRFHVESL